MDFNNICRTCLSRNNLNPIFTNEIDSAIKLDIMFAATGVNIQFNDGLPQNICLDCFKTLQYIMDFRKKCKDTETELMAIKKEEENDKSDFDTKGNINDIKFITIKSLHNQNNNIKLKIETCNEIDIKNEINESGYDDDEDDKPLIFLTENSQYKNEIKVMKEALYDINDNSSRITCKLCQKNLSKRSFNMHMARHHPGVDDSRVQCELCNDYILKDNLNRHLVSIHGTDSFKCRYCKKEHKNKELLVKHVTNCTVKKRRRTCKSSRELTECDVCNKKMQKASLRMHKAIKHAGLGPVCEHCGKRFGNKFRLDEHYRAKHGYEKFKCSYCDFQSAAVVAMRNHERRHRGEKPFVCESCGAKFHAAYLLAQHRHSHRTDKLFKCSQCPAAFKANNSLHTHRRACHGAARVACAVCARAYSCRHYAVKHMRAVHRYRGPVPPLAHA
ncbi:unnamed protein product [Euphydryas editha]|uniref:Zinc finger protein n=1 Tax=Euphydryas editha TaxID=104508 RepID=A0AAU9UUD2_EUPED|nr:unnamed protein product [Euphydryas editha]